MFDNLNFLIHPAGFFTASLHLIFVSSSFLTANPDAQQYLYSFFSIL